MTEDILEMRTVPLVKFCRLTGYSLKYVRSILNGFDANLRRRFVQSGAVVRLGGRWFVRPQKLAAWDTEQTLEWESSQPVN